MVGKKAMSLPVKIRQNWISEDPEYSIRRQCRLAGISRNNFYYAPVVESKETLDLMSLIDERYLNRPDYGSPRMTDWLQDQGYGVNRKRVARLMRLMGLQAITPGPDTSKPCTAHKVYPYLLRGVAITHPNQVWSTDITYIPMKGGFLYLTAVIDWFSRYVLSWELSNSMESHFCVVALERAMSRGVQPQIFNTDQGSQFTSKEFTEVLQSHEVAISMDGKGRALDNVFIERLWWTVKYEDIYPKDYLDGKSLSDGLTAYFRYYNEERKHSKLDNQTPGQVYLN
jgi:putative transposase